MGRLEGSVRLTSKYIRQSSSAAIGALSQHSELVSQCVLKEIKQFSFILLENNKLFACKYQSSWRFCTEKIEVYLA